MRAEYREEPCKVALNRVKGMGFKWSLNPYMGCVHRCTFCYVRAFERRADRPSDDRYGRSIRVKTNVAEVLRRELARPSWEPETVAIGAATDPYQPAEGRYRLTRSCIEALGDAHIRASVGIAPILPGISDKPELLEHVVREAREAGACGVWANLLNLRPGTREHFLECLADDYPEQLPAYERLYARRAYLKSEETRPVRALVSDLTRKHGIRDRRRTKLAPEPDPEQLALTL
jgi:DNA repair photolyase